MKKIFLILAISLILGGCGAKKIEESVVSKTGIIKTKIGSEYVMDVGGELVNITSNKVSLDNYLKKQITVTGMFSGSTLYVDKVSE